MLILPPYKKLWRNKYPGIVQAVTAQHTYIRAATKAIEPLTVNRINWRHIFGNHRKNWASLAEGGQGYVLVNNIEPQVAWQIENTSTFNILIPFLREGPVGQPLQLGNVASELAYYTMVQSNLSALKLPPRTAPLYTNLYCAIPTAPQNQTIGAFSVTIDTYSTPNTDSPAFQTVIQWAASPLPAAPTSFTASAPTATIILGEIFPLNQGTIANPQPNFAYAAVMIVTPGLASAAGNETVTLNWTDTNGPQTATFTVALTNGYPATALAPITFAIPLRVVAHCVLDEALNLIGFDLIHKIQSPYNTVMQRGIPVGGIALQAAAFYIDPNWVLQASAPYSSIYKPPAASSYLTVSHNAPIEYPGYGAPQYAVRNKDNILDQLIATYGPMPAEGHIKFAVTPVDAVTGVGGDTLTCTAQWTAGTFKGSQFSLWQGNGWECVLWTNDGNASSVTGSNPYTVTVPNVSLGTVTAAQIAYIDSLPDGTAQGPFNATVANGNQFTFTIPAGTPAPTTGDFYFTVLNQAAVTPGAPAYMLLLASTLINSGQPTNTNPWQTPTDAWPTNYAFPTTQTFALKANAIIPDGLGNGKRKLPAGLTMTPTPVALTWDAETPQQMWAVLAFNAEATTMSFQYTLSIEMTDGVYETFGALTITVDNSAVPALPATFITTDKYAYTPGLSSPGTFTFPVTLSNTQDDDTTVSMLSTTQSTLAATAQQILATPITITWDNQTPTVPAGNATTPGTITVNCTITVPANIDTAAVQTQLVVNVASYNVYATVT